ncbi:MAG TPA: hypothetical protein PLM24_00335 [Methanothrix sp.]|nr:hypothetical protein [Methanothrix sp.]HPJ83315.1 hypothetical protein [Methanothrix sp.]HPR65564.1 hypothetical protein [Methanothrix sp.]
MEDEIRASSKKEASIDPSLKDIEEAYLDLMKAYSACLAALILEKRKRWHYMVPLVIRWRTKKRVDMLRVTFLLLIAAESDAETEIIKRFKLYCEDMKSLSDQLLKSGCMDLLFGSTPAILIILFSFVKSMTEIQKETFNKLFLDISNLFSLGLLLLLLLLSLLIIFIIILIFAGFPESGRMFSRFGVFGKDKQFYRLIRNYSSRG